MRFEWAPHAVCTHDARAIRPAARLGIATVVVLLVASTMVSEVESHGLPATSPVLGPVEREPRGMVHAYRSGDDQTLCEVPLEELVVSTQYLRSPRWPNMCADCHRIALVNGW